MPNAGAPYLSARNGLPVSPQPTHGIDDLPQGVHPHHLTKLFRLRLVHSPRNRPLPRLGTDYTRIGKKEIQPALFLDHPIDERLDGRAVGCIALEVRDLGAWVGGLDVLAQGWEVGNVVVEQVQVRGGFAGVYLGSCRLLVSLVQV